MEAEADAEADADANADADSDAEAEALHCCECLGTKPSLQQRVWFLNNVALG